MSFYRKAIKAFPYGQIDTIEDQAIPAGAASRALNWISQGDRIELRRGYLLLGADDGVGAVTGLHVGVKANGDQVLFKKYARKIKYYDEPTSLFVENGTNVLPAAATDDDVTFDNYASLAGNQVVISSPNSGLYKIMTANPGSLTDLTDTSKNFAGFLRVYFNRIILWFRLKDKTGIYGSYIDAAVYTTVTGEATTSLGGTLAFKGGGTKRTCFGLLLTLTGTGEIYTDDFSGNLVGSLGGTGTINYTTGVYTLSNAGVGTVNYQWEDSTNHGIGDFTKSGTRLAGEGFVFRQDDNGGDAQGVGVYGDILYCLHKFRTWQLALTQDDTGATNLPYRDKVGIPNSRAYVPTGNGVYYVDDQNSGDTQLRLLTLQQLSGLVVPTSVSKRSVKGIILGVDLSGYVFDKAAMAEWGDYIVVAMRRVNSEANDRILIYNKNSGAFSFHDYFASCFIVYNGDLLAGDSVSNNVYVLFSGFDDDDSLISTNFYETELSDLAIQELKKCKKLVIQGLISPSQSFDVSASVDNGTFVPVGSIDGLGAYVDTSSQIQIGNSMVGQREIGGGGTGVNAYNYEHPIRLALDKFKKVKLRFVATGIGYLSINQYEWFDIRLKGNKIVKKYR